MGSAGLVRSSLSTKKYDKVMEIVNNTMKGYKEKTMTIYVGMFEPFLDAYLKGETRTVDRGLTDATRTLEN
jgi:hypothetical protein